MAPYKTDGRGRRTHVSATRMKVVMRCKRGRGRRRRRRTDGRTTTSTAALTLQLAPSVHRACNFGGGCSHVSRQAWQPSPDRRWSVVPHVSKKPGKKVLQADRKIDRIFEIFPIGKTKYNTGGAYYFCRSPNAHGPNGF